MLVFVLKEQLTWWLIAGALLRYRAKQRAASGPQASLLKIEANRTVRGHQVQA
jgi:hypothetical protein